MRRSKMFSMLVAVAIVSGAVAVGASGDPQPQPKPQPKQKRTIVVPPEVIEELQKLAREAFGEVTFGDLSRELTRAMQDLGRELGHFSDGRLSVGGGFVQDKEFRAEAVDKQTKTLAIGPNGTIELKNVIGDISVKAGGGREATVEIVRTSRGRTDADAKLGLQRVTANVTTRGDRGTVSVEYPEERRPPYYVAVAYNVTAPAGASVLVQTITGNVTLNGIRGETSVNTTTGSVDIAQAADLTAAHTVTGKLVIRDSQGDALDIGTMNGAMHLSNIKTRRLELSAVTGPITAQDVHAGGVEASCMSCEISYAGSVTPGGRYEFTSHNGTIRLGLSGGFDFEGHSFSGRIEADPALGFKPSPSSERVGGLGMRRQALRGVVGGGGAVVQATTFSGEVRIGRTVPPPAKRGGGK